MARQVRSIDVRITEVSPGVLRLSQPATPGWAGVARNLPQLGALVASAFREGQVAAVASWRGVPYETPDGTRYQRRRPGRRGHRSDTHDPREWRIAPDGRWIAPGAARSRLWSPDSQVVQRVKYQRMRLGLPPEPEPAEAEAT